MPSRTRATRDARRPSVSSAASTTYQRRSISALAERVGLGVHLSPCSPFDPAARERRPRTTRRSTGHAPGHSPRRGPAVRRRAPRRPPLSVILPCPTSRRTATIRRTIPRRKASAVTSIVTTRPLRRDPDRVNGPDRRPVRRPEGAEVVPAHQDRPGSRHRGDIERVPHPERVALAERTARPVPDGVAVFPIPRRIARVEPGRDPLQVTDRDIRREERIERPTQLLRRGPTPIGECDHLPGGVDPGVGPSRRVDRRRPGGVESGQRGLEFSLDRPPPGWTWKPAKSVPSYSTVAR